MVVVEVVVMKMHFYIFLLLRFFQQLNEFMRSCYGAATYVVERTNEISRSSPLPQSALETETLLRLSDQRALNDDNERLVQELLSDGDEKIVELSKQGELVANAQDFWLVLANDLKLIYAIFAFYEANNSNNFRYMQMFFIFTSYFTSEFIDEILFLILYCMNFILYEAWPLAHYC